MFGDHGEQLYEVFGIDSGEASVQFAVTQQRKQKIVAGLVGGIAAMCKQRKVEVFNGVGSLGAGLGGFGGGDSPYTLNPPEFSIPGGQYPLRTRYQI